MLQQIQHRPWPLPSGPWIMVQSWIDLLFAHWPLPAEQLQQHVPEGLALDTYEGQAWLSIVPFHITGLRLRWTPALPWIASFPEINVRTYVTYKDRPGVLFFSLDAGNPLDVAAARLTYKLPYFNADMVMAEQNGWITYDSRRTHRGAPPAEFAGRYRAAGPAAAPRPGTLEHWLTERYCLYTTDRRGRLLRAEIHHGPWLLQPAEAIITTNSMAAAHGLQLPNCEPILQFSQTQTVVVWPLQALSRQGTA